MQRNSPRAFRRSEFGVIPQQQRDAARVPRWGRRRGEDLVDVANAAARGHRIALGVDERGILSGGGAIDTAHRRRRREMLKWSVIVGPGGGGGGGGGGGTTLRGGIAKSSWNVTRYATFTSCYYPKR